MTTGKGTPTVREAVGIFHNADSLRGAIEELLSSGFTEDELGLLASEQVVERSLGDMYIRTNATTGSPDAPAIAFVRRESLGDTARTHTGGLFFVGTSGAVGGIVASSALLGGALLPAVGAVVGVGLVGLMVASFIHQSDAEYLQQQIDEGHILLFVRSIGREGEAMNILRRHSGLDVKVYQVPVKSTSEPNAAKAVNS
jgi:outer membrane lipoprotein SlyB